VKRNWIARSTRRLEGVGKRCRLPSCFRLVSCAQRAGRDAAAGVASSDAAGADRARARGQMQTAPPGIERRWGGREAGDTVVTRPVLDRTLALSAPAELAHPVPALRGGRRRIGNLPSRKEAIDPAGESHLRHARPARSAARGARRRTPPGRREAVGCGAHSFRAHLRRRRRHSAQALSLSGNRTPVKTKVASPTHARRVARRCVARIAGSRRQSR
jgi:hypothetical protein